MDDKNDRDSSYGQSASDWEKHLRSALDARDHQSLRSLLRSLGGEMRDERVLSQELDSAPLFDRLLEQARRLARSNRTDEEALEQELSAERSVWADYRERYRETFIPAALRPFIRSSAVFLSPTDQGVGFPGFEKFAGCTPGRKPEAVTLFLQTDEMLRPDTAPATPANFFAVFEQAFGRFTVERVYRTALPHGSGLTCVLEQVGWLVPDLAMFKELVFENVQNRPTYDAHVVVDEAGRSSLRSDVGVDDSPMGRFGKRILNGLGFELALFTPTLDRFGILDFCFRRA